MTTFPGTSLYISGTHIWITVFICQCFISDKQVSCLIWVRWFITVLKNTRQIGQWPTLIIWYWHFARGLDDSINVMKNDQKSCWNVVLLYLNKFYNKQHSCIMILSFFLNYHTKENHICKWSEIQWWIIIYNDKNDKECLFLYKALSVLWTL